MKFFVRKSDKNRCQYIFGDIWRRGHTIEVLGNGGVPHINGESVATIIAVRALERSGKTPGQVRRVTREQVEGLGGELPSWACGEIFAIAPQIDLSQFDPPVQAEVRRHIRGQLTVALDAAERESNPAGK